MDDIEQRMRNSWRHFLRGQHGKKLPWAKLGTIRVPLLSAVPLTPDYSEEIPTAPEVSVMSVKREFGRFDGVPWCREIGSIGDVKIILSEGPVSESKEQE